MMEFGAERDGSLACDFWVEEGQVGQLSLHGASHTAVQLAVSIRDLNPSVFCVSPEPLGRAAAHCCLQYYL